MKSTRKFKDYALKHAKIRKDKKVKGFTLVELIIVIAIIGILAAVLIPTMSGKVKESKIATANDEIAKIVEQAGVIATELEQDGSYSVCGSEYTAAEISMRSKKSGEGKDDFAEAFYKAFPKLDNDKAQIYIKFNGDGAVVSAVYAADDKTSYVGRYPNPIDKESYDKAKKFSNYKEEAAAK